MIACLDDPQRLGLLCQVCGIETALGVASSIGPMSVAYCRTCLSLRAEPLWVLESTDQLCDFHMRPEYYWIMTFYKGNYFPYGEVADGIRSQRLH